MQRQGLCLLQPLRLKIKPKAWECPWWNGLDCSEQSWFCLSSFIHVYKGVNYLAPKSPCSPTWLCELVFLFWNPSFVKFSRCFDWAECSFFLRMAEASLYRNWGEKLYRASKAAWVNMGLFKKGNWISPWFQVMFLASLLIAWVSGVSEWEGGREERIRREPKSQKAHKDHLILRLPLLSVKISIIILNHYVLLFH